jgi:hypothetical protein
MLKINTGTIKKHTNTGNGGPTKWKKEMLKFEDIANKFINFKSFVNDGDDRIFSIFYKGAMPPKTKRLVLRKKINNYNEIPLVSVEYRGDNSLLTYKITKNEIDNFLNEIKTILNSKLYFEERFKNASEKQITLISRLLLISDIISPFVDIQDFIISDTQLYDVTFSWRWGDTLKKLNEILDDEVVLDNFDDRFNSCLIEGEILKKILNKAPWIVSNKCKYRPQELYIEDQEISDLLNEEIKLNLDNINLVPTVGVIDSSCDLEGDFTNFIDSYNFIEDGYEIDSSHGNSVTSLIVAYDELNPKSKDNLGNFRVRHFGLMGRINNKVTVSHNWFIEKLESIIKDNSDIKIWNISMGVLKNEKFNNFEISSNAKFVDYLEHKYDVLFFVPSGNVNKEDNKNNYVLSPSDSYNSISVGSVQLDHNEKANRATYSLIGQIDKYIKPDISCFGGPKTYNGTDLMLVKKGNFVHLNESNGTSFSVPQATRMAAYYMNEYNLSCVETKAFLLNNTIREVPAKKSSYFGILDNVKKKTNQVHLTAKIDVSGKDRHVIGPLNLNQVDSIGLSLNHFVEPNRQCINEYSDVDIEINLYKAPNNWEELISDPKVKFKTLMTFAKIIKSSEDVDVKMNSGLGKFENKLRNNEKKFYNSKLKHVKLEGDNIKTNDEFYFIGIKKTELYDFNNQRTINVGVSISLNGDKISEDEFYRNNSAIVDQMVDVEQDVG